MKTQRAEYYDINETLLTVCSIKAKTLEPWLQLPEFRTEVEKIIFSEKKNLTVFDVVSIMQRIKEKALTHEEFYPGFLLRIEEYEDALDILHERIAKYDPAYKDFLFLFNTCLSISEEEISAWFLNPSFCTRVRNELGLGCRITETDVLNMMKETFEAPKTNESHTLSGREKRYKNTIRRLEKAIVQGTATDELSFVYKCCPSLNKIEISSLLRDRPFANKILELKRSGTWITEQLIMSVIKELIATMSPETSKYRKLKKILRHLQQTAIKD